MRMQHPLIDLLVEGAVIVEVKAIERLERIHTAQLLSYLRFAGCHAGLLFNFNVAWFARDGIKRVVNNFPE
jgi:GxxExxY protein